MASISIKMTGGGRAGDVSSYYIGGGPDLLILLVALVAALLVLAIVLVEELLSISAIRSQMAMCKWSARRARPGWLWDVNVARGRVCRPFSRA